MISNNKHFSAEWEYLQRALSQVLELAHSTPTAENRCRYNSAISAVIMSLDRLNNMKAESEAPKQTGAGTHADPIRYEHIKSDDPDRQIKRAAQREQFEKDAKAGRVLCLTDLMISHEM